MSQARSVCLVVVSLLTFIFVWWPHDAWADVFRPAYLEMRETDGKHYDVLFKVPAQSEDVAMALDVEFPIGTKTVGARHVVFTGDALVQRFQVHREGGFVGQAVRIVGTAARVTDLIARVERPDGTSQVERLSFERPEFVVTAPAGLRDISWSYLVLGVEHILAGIDHLLFVLALLLIVRGVRPLLTTITAFTLAHSLTLGGASLGWVYVPGPPVEAIIALSIVFVAAEVIHERRGQPGLTSQKPWLVAFTFGLLHGLGFAGALAEVGLPESAVVLALLMFNVGVELGQVVFVGAVLSVLALGRVLMERRSISLERASWLVWLARWGAPYVIGCVATFWVFERVVGFWE